MHKQNIKNLALSCEDNIFELISREHLNKIYNELKFIYQRLFRSHKYRNLELNKFCNTLQTKNYKKKGCRRIPQFSNIRSFRYKKNSSKAKTTLYMDKCVEDG